MNPLFDDSCDCDHDCDSDDDTRETAFTAALPDFDLPYHPELLPDSLYEEEMASLTLASLIRAQWPRLVRFARARLPTRQEAEDLVQDVCLEVLEGDLRLPIDPEGAVQALREEIVARSRRGGDPRDVQRLLRQL